MSSLVGSFLVAGPALDLSKFRQAVVLILQHRKEGTFGLVVNRPTTQTGQPFTVFSGGPCKAHGLLMLHGHADWHSDEMPVREVAAGIYIGDFGCVKRVSESADRDGFRFRMFNGYACWNRGQVEAELAAGIWTVVPADAQVLFETPAEELWDLLGPPRLPQPSRN
jgi:putative transcriptional regulator